MQTYMKQINIQTLKHLGLFAFALTMLVLPNFSFAATANPSCSLTVTTEKGTTTFNDSEKIYTEKGSVVVLLWSSRNATKAITNSDDTIGLTGVEVKMPTKDTTYGYEFTGNGKKVTCEANIVIAEGSIKESTLTTSKSTPTISGKAENVKSVYVKVYKEGSTKPVFTSKTIKVKKDAWSVKVTKKLADGQYNIVVTGDKKVLLNTLVTGVLTVGDVDTTSASANTTIVVEQIPLLIGGIAHAGGLLPLSYLQVINIGKEVATLSGFNVIQTGNASTNSILSLSTVDDTGLLRSSVDGVAGSSLFKNGSAFIPTVAVLKPGEMHLFTIKAGLVPNVSAYVGTQLGIRVSAVKSNAKTTRGVFPIGGVQWTIAN